MKTKLLMSSLCLLGIGAAVFADPLPKSGDSIAFLGDSITNYGVGSESGYVRMVVSGLKANGIEVKMIPAGVPGNKAHHMLARMDKDVIAKNPTWMTLSCGVNDLWFLDESSTVEKFKAQVPDIVEKAQKAGIKVLLMTPTTVLGEKHNPNLDPYCEFMRQLAKEKNIPLADTNAAIRAEIDRRKVTLDGRLKVTSDGVHMAPVGDRVMARCVLKAFGLSDEQLKKAEAHWQTIPEACSWSVKPCVSLDTYRKLEKMADERNVKINDLYAELLEKGLDVLIEETAKKQ